jgi:hypothetical protein
MTLGACIFLPRYIINNFVEGEPALPITVSAIAVEFFRLFALIVWRDGVAGRQWVAELLRSGSSTSTRAVGKPSKLGPTTCLALPDFKGFDLMVRDLTLRSAPDSIGNRHCTLTAFLEYLRAEGFTARPEQWRDNSQAASERHLRS